MLQTIRVFETELDVEQNRTPQESDVDLSDICLVPELAVTCGASMHGTLWPSSVTLSLYMEFCEASRSSSSSSEAEAELRLLHGATILDRSDDLCDEALRRLPCLRARDRGLSVEFEGARVLELGAGTGVCGLVCRRFTRAAHVTVTDVGAALPLIERNRARLGVEADAERLSIAELWWGEFGERFARERVDVLMASDIIYETKSHDALLATLVHFGRLNPQLVVILAHRRRYAHEDQFFASLERAGFKKRDILRRVTTPQQRQRYDLDSEYYLYQIWQEADN